MFNVKFTNDLIYKKYKLKIENREYEYYSFTSTIKIPNDILLNVVEDFLYLEIFYHFSYSIIKIVLIFELKFVVV